MGPVLSGLGRAFQCPLEGAPGAATLNTSSGWPCLTSGLQPSSTESCPSENTMSLCLLMEPPALKVTGESLSVRRSSWLPPRGRSGVLPLHLDLHSLWPCPGGTRGCAERG